MGLDDEQQVFLTQEDQEDDNINQFQTKSGESFDFKQGYDTVVYEVHKQYKLRSRTINAPELVKAKDTKQPKMTKEKVTLTETIDAPDANPKEVTIEDVTETYPSNEQQWTTSSSEPNPINTPQKIVKTEMLQDENENQDRITKNIVEKGKAASHNTKTQSEKPFHLEAEIGKLKIAIPLSEISKHDIYKQQIKKSLQITQNKDDVNVLDDTSELLFGPEVDGKTISTGVLPFYVSLHIHDKILHNAMFDSGASHNLMPKSVM